MPSPSSTLDHLSALLAKPHRDATAAPVQRGAGPRPQAILAIRGSFAYDFLNRLLGMIAKPWQEVGTPLVEIDLSAPDWPSRIAAVLEFTQVLFCISMAGIVLEIAVKAKSLWELFRFPVFCLHCDHPAYYAPRHRRLPSNVVLGYLFRDHAIYQRDHVKAPNLVTSLDFGIPDLPLKALPATETGAAPTVVFAKTGNDPRTLEARWRTRPVLERLIRDLLDEVGFASCNAYPAAVQKVAAAHRLELHPFDRLTRLLIVQADDYVRRRKSDWIVEAIKPFPVDVYGDGWEYVAREGARARFHGGVSYDAVSDATARAAASVTMNPNIEMSAHDRFFTALGAGVMPISDGNAFIGEHFPQLEPFTFKFASGSLEAALERVFSRPRDALELARSTRAHAIERWSTRQAAQHIRACVDLADYLDFSFAPPQPFFTF